LPGGRADARAVGTIAALIIALGLAIIPYNYGTGRWPSEWTKNTWGIGLMMFVIFLPWYVVAVGLGASRTVTPVTMILFAGAFGCGHLRGWRRARSKR
jgi:hypothetical protein